VIVLIMLLLIIVLLRILIPTLFPYTTLFRSGCLHQAAAERRDRRHRRRGPRRHPGARPRGRHESVEGVGGGAHEPRRAGRRHRRSEEHTSELQSPCNLVCRLLLEKKKKKQSY